MLASQASVPMTIAICRSSYEPDPYGQSGLKFPIGAPVMPDGFKGLDVASPLISFLMCTIYECLVKQIANPVI